MKAIRIFFPLFLVLALFFSACSGTGNGNSEMAGPSEDQAAATPAQKALSPAEIGGQVGDLYITAMQDVIEMLKDKPEPADVMSKVAELKENYVQKFVELGRMREELSDADRGTLDMTLRQKVYSAGNESWFDTFNDIQMYYFSNRDFNKLILSFNIITQYANFDLLNQQEPEEAKRLGVEK